MLDELVQKAYDAIIELDEDAVHDVLGEIKETGADFKVILERGFSAAMAELGEQFSAGEVFMPDLVYAADMMQQVGEAFETYLDGLDKDETEIKGKVVFATVEGDVHDIGKGICISLGNTKSLQINDLGRDVPPQKIIDEAESMGADIIAMSAMLTTTMEACGKVIKLLEEQGLRDKYYVMVGGAPVTKKYADKIHADLYTEDGVEFAAAAQEYIVQKYGR
ncbi:MAG: cobalamin B12-binding domain-containing protein [Ruminococcus sp.]